MTIIEQIEAAGLKVDPRMRKYLSSDLATICNGCGAAGSWLNYFIPSSYKNIDFSPACLKHDFAYYVGESLADKVAADLQFLIDLMILCNKDLSIGKRKLHSLHRRAYLYFAAVDRYGHHAFVADKDISLSLKEIIKKLPNPKRVYDLGVGDMY